MIKHLPIKVLEDVTKQKITNTDKKIINKVQEHNAKVYKTPSNNQLV